MRHRLVYLVLDLFETTHFQSSTPSLYCTDNIQYTVPVPSSSRPSQTRNLKRKTTAMAKPSLRPLLLIVIASSVYVYLFSIRKLLSNSCESSPTRATTLIDGDVTQQLELRTQQINGSSAASLAQSPTEFSYQVHSLFQTEYDRIAVTNHSVRCE